MAILPIKEVPDPVLRRKARQVSRLDGSIQRLIEDMIETMHYAQGVGIAAPQVGVSLRVVAIETPEEGSFVLINPKMVKRRGERVVQEGCLSLPGYRGEIKRAEQVVVKGLDSLGKEVRVKAQGLLAQALEHELDHINGILYIDHLESQDKLYRLEPLAEEASAEGGQEKP